MTTEVGRRPAGHRIPALVKPALLRIQDGLRDARVRYRARQVKAHLMPSFLIIGGQKCGTTFLYHLLTQHSQIEAALTKEVHFFDNHFHRGIDWYRAHFPRHKVDSPELITGEASPYYLFHPHAARRISECLPEVKLIVLLRDPVRRAFSHYHHEVRLGFETLSFEEALARETERLKGEEERLQVDSTYYSFAHHHYGYLQRGIYADQLARWWQYFDRNQILILQSEIFYRDPLQVTREIARFLELKEWDITLRTKTNRGSYSRLDDHLVDHLTSFYEPHNQRLFDMLDVNWDW